MLKRISKLTNIGRFTKASCGSAEFGAITVIFGRNTYGKTTLGDLLSSIESKDLGNVKRRRSIPHNNEEIEANLTFLPQNQESESALNLTADGWVPELPDGLRFAVFDDGFYHNNVFAARQFTRTTKENFSDFVLGAQGVAKANEISKKNQEKLSATRERNRLKADVFSNVEELSKFLASKPKRSIEEIEAEIHGLREEFGNVEKQRKDSTAIRQRKDCNELPWDIDFSAKLTSLNEILGKSLAAHHEEAQKAVDAHIAKHFKSGEGAENWIRVGLQQNKGKVCQFCSQPLDEEANQLFELYRKSFDSAFNDHESKIKLELKAAHNELTSADINRVRLFIEGNSGAFIAYSEISGENEYSEKKVHIEHSAKRLQDLLSAWDERQVVFEEILSTTSAKKEASPHVAIDSISEEKLSKLDKELVSEIGQYNRHAREMNQILNEFKKSVDPQSLNDRLNAILIKEKKAKRDLLRLQLDEQVIRYVELESTITALATEIPKLEKELREEQSNYLDSFFTSLNRWFEGFGSQDFSLERGEDSSGHTPIYYLKVRFRNQRISERDLESVFSESDRRALALSVFWASLTGLGSHEMKKRIVVLDDPVTSFDDNRITAVHQEIIRLSDAVRQIIVLSHYNIEVSKFLSTYRNSKPLVLLSIETNSGCSNIVKADISEFIKSDHQKKTSNILKFIDGETDSHNAGDLRIFLETEISQRFAKQISSSNNPECLLSERIDQLREDTAVSSDVADEAHMWRETLNPSHHTWTGDNLEDQRLNARRFMDFIYHRLVANDGS